MSAAHTSGTSYNLERRAGTKAGRALPPLAPPQRGGAEGGHGTTAEGRLPPFHSLPFLCRWSKASPLLWSSTVLPAKVDQSNDPQQQHTATTLPTTIDRLEAAGRRLPFRITLCMACVTLAPGLRPTSCVVKHSACMRRKGGRSVASFPPFSSPSPPSVRPPAVPPPSFSSPALSREIPAP